MTNVNDLSAGNPFADYEGKPEPDCTTCRDRGVLLDEAAEGHAGSGQHCPDCTPAAAVELMAALKASFGRAKKNRDELRTRFETLERDPTAQPL